MNAIDEQAVLELLDRMRTRFYGKYRGTVTDVDAATFRVKAKVPSVLGTAPTGWATPCVPYAGDGVGIAFLPESGAGVWIEFEGGDVSYPIWTGCYWLIGQVPADATATVKAIVTTAGHKILFDDDGGTVTITDVNENTATLASSGITLKRGSRTVVVSDTDVNVNDGAFQVT